MYWEQTLVFLEPRDRVKPRRLGEFSVQAVRPAMVLAGEHTDVPFLFGDEGEPAMPADIVEAMDGALSINAQEKREPSLVESEEVSRLAQS